MLHQMASRKAALIFSNLFVASLDQKRKAPAWSQCRLMRERAVVPPAAYRGHCLTHLSSSPQEPQAPWWPARSLQLKVRPRHHPSPRALSKSFPVFMTSSPFSPLILSHCFVVFLLFCFFAFKCQWTQNSYKRLRLSLNIEICDILSLLLK